MTADKVFNLLGSIVTVALVTSILSPRSQTAKVVRALGDFFIGSIQAALGAGTRR
jgi:hypothetical protein